MHGQMRLPRPNSIAVLLTERHGSELRQPVQSAKADLRELIRAVCFACADAGERYESNSKEYLSFSHVLFAVSVPIPHYIDLCRCPRLKHRLADHQTPGLWHYVGKILRNGLSSRSIFAQVSQPDQHRKRAFELTI